MMVVLEKVQKTLAAAAQIHKKVGRLESEQEHQEIETGWGALLQSEHRRRDETSNALAFESDSDADADERPDEYVARVVDAKINARQRAPHDAEEDEKNPQPS